MNFRKTLIFFLSISFFLGLVSCSKELRTMNHYAKKGTISQKDTAAMYFMRRKDYDKASIMLEELVGIMKNTARGEELLRSLAFAKYKLKENVMATYYYDQYLREYPNSDHAEEAAYLQAYCFFDQSDPYFLDQSYTIKAMESLQNFLNQYPKSEHSAEASRYLSDLRERMATKSYENARLYHKLSNYKSAVYSLQTFIQEYPDSKYREYAQYLLVQSAVSLAAQSVDAKKENRYLDAIEHYTKFIDKFPASQYRKQAEDEYDRAKKGLENIKKASASK